MNPSIVSYKNQRFPPQVIAHAVWLYFRFPLSLRLMEEMLLERGIVISYETIRRWGRKFRAAYAKQLRRKNPSRKDIWHLDKGVISIGGRKYWLWRAVDQDGYVLDEIVQSCRDTTPERIVWPRGRSDRTLFEFFQYLIASAPLQHPHHLCFVGRGCDLPRDFTLGP